MPAFHQTNEDWWIFFWEGGWWEEGLTLRSTIVKDWPIVNLSHKVSLCWHTHPVIHITRSRFIKIYSMSHSVGFIKEAFIQVEVWSCLDIFVDSFPDVHESILTTSQSPWDYLETTVSIGVNVQDFVIVLVNHGREISEILACFNKECNFLGWSHRIKFWGAETSFSWNLDPSSLRQHVLAGFFQTE